MPEDHRGEVLLLFFEVVEMYFYEGKLKEAVEVADGLQLSSKLVVDKDERQRILDLCLLLHAYILTIFIFV